MRLGEAMMVGKGRGGWQHPRASLAQGLVLDLPFPPGDPWESPGFRPHTSQLRCSPAHHPSLRTLSSGQIRYPRAAFPPLLFLFFFFLKNCCLFYQQPYSFFFFHPPLLRQVFTTSSPGFVFPQLNASSQAPHLCF